MPLLQRLCLAGMTMELRHLRAFIAIAEEGTITHAAARLRIGQPALSRTLKALESHLGVRLFDRSTHHLRLTDAGESFRIRAAAALNAAEAAFDPDRVGPWPLRLGHAWSALGHHTATVLHRWQQLHPQTPLQLLRTDDSLAGLAQGRADAVLLRGPMPVTGIRSTVLFHEQRMAALSSHNDLAKRSELALDDLASQTLIMNTVSGTTTLRLWSPEHQPGRIAEVGNTDDWLAALAADQGFGVTTTATADIYPYPGVTYLPLTDAPPVPVNLAWSDPPSHPAVPDLAAFIREIAQPTTNEANGPE
ncbi:LysR family transcriptional regulator [Streptomyces sp. 110]|uniref:LysR family transcriptional regulator n=2 Tax=Streptomyces endocoffeicus TaxID=2898945 RepID=A0ABS1Q862_9ACTN|nr:LysR family transcriptional regulator [Streptomyces endocoffeicus]